ncbi:MAG TPA: YebC/PmpR family DNA-binding transcriptional regulator [Patescibacteria group bacterium]|nr:YebC/PmpR family DNA-binding transcriptional regulator [Patescibacteria group bacterium]
MSGHSHYSTIKRQKDVKDAQKGKVFSKMSKAISIAIKAGGNADPESNYKLRMVIDTAKSMNMPKENIDRVINRAKSESENLEEVYYEGYGPNGIAVIVEAATDNRNRSAQEIKNIFERGGGTLAGPGSVSYNFMTKGLLLVEKAADADAQMLALIDLGVDDINDAGDVLEVYVAPDKTAEFRDLIMQKGFKVTSASIIKKPINLQLITDKDAVTKILKFLDNLEEYEDVQNVFSNIDIPDDLVI